MYQSAFLSLEFRLNSELVSSVAKHEFKKKSSEIQVQLSFQFYTGKKQRK